jgi:predicted anti-sigma-YlaC factor YlaD
MATEDKDNLLDAPSVEAWLEKNEPAGIEKLHNAVKQGSVNTPRARAFVMKYLWSRDATPITAAEARAVVRDNRAKKSVKRALRWAVAAVVLASATLFLSVWLILNDWKA